MSAGRVKRDPLDRYDTPERDVRRFLTEFIADVPEIEQMQEDVHAIWEPAAGSGSMLAPLRQAFPQADLIASDIEPRNEGISQRDFLETFDITADLIITNPPFRLAEHFLRHAMEVVNDDGWVVLFLRAGFLESRRRANLFEQFPPLMAYFLRTRPRFTGPNSDGTTTDTALYAWLIWRKDGMRPLYFEGRIL